MPYLTGTFLENGWFNMLIQFPLVHGDCFRNCNGNLMVDGFCCHVWKHLKHPPETGNRWRDQFFVYWIVLGINYNYRLFLYQNDNRFPMNRILFTGLDYLFSCFRMLRTFFRKRWFLAGKIIVFDDHGSRFWELFCLVLPQMVVGSGKSVDFFQPWLDDMAKSSSTNGWKIPIMASSDKIPVILSYVFEFYLLIFVGIFVGYF